MLTFNDLLSLGGVDPKGVKLLRHVVGSHPLLDIWRTDRARVERYQEGQSRPVLRGASHAACFLVDHKARSVFCGLYAVEAEHPARYEGQANEITGEIEPTWDGYRYDLVVDEFAEYEDRVVIDWFPRGRSRGWHHWAGRNPKPVIEIATQEEAPFPGWLEFVCPVDDLGALPRSWREVLRATSGIYLLTDATGRHYVGSAKGGDGLLGRWNAYREGRSGGNVGLTDAVGPFTVAVLQTFDPSTPDQTVEMVESMWKSKLGAREAGYNRN